MSGAVDEGEWVAVSQIAKMRGVSRQAISKRVKGLGDRLPSRGEGRDFRVHLQTFERLVAVTHDPAQDLRNRHQKRDDAAGSEAPPPVAEPAPAKREASAYDDASARKKNAEAAAAEMKLAQLRGELVPAKEIEAAAITAGTEIVQIISRMRSSFGKLYAASKGGEEALRIELHEMFNAALAEIGDSMAKLAARGAQEAD